MKLEGKSLLKDFVRFMIPSVIAQWVFALYTMIDGLFVARGVSETALAAVNIAMPFVNFLFSVSLLFAVGASTIIAIKMGQQKLEEANQIFTQNIVLLLLLSVLIALIVFFNLDRICVFLGATDQTISYVKEYIMTIALFNGCFMIAYSFEILVKTDGAPKFATIAVTSGALLHCLLDYIFVIKLNFGVQGAALATGSSQAFLVILYLSHFLSKRASLKFRRFKFNMATVWRTIKIGLPSGVTELSAGMSVFILNHAILQYIGNDALISYTIIAYVNTIVVMSMAGVAQGFQPLVSYHYGKKNDKACKKLLGYGSISAAIVSFIIFIFCLLFADIIVALFISPEMSALRIYSAKIFRIFSISFLLLGQNVVLGGYFTAVERPKAALSISISRGFITLIISLFILIQLAGGEGIWWSPTLSEALCLVLSVWLYRRYQQQKQKSVECIA